MVKYADVSKERTSISRETELVQVDDEPIQITLKMEAVHSPEMSNI